MVWGCLGGRSGVGHLQEMSLEAMGMLDLLNAWSTDVMAGTGAAR